MVFTYHLASKNPTKSMRGAKPNFYLRVCDSVGGASYLTVNVLLLCSIANLVMQAAVLVQAKVKYNYLNRFYKIVGISKFCFIVFSS